MKTISMMAVAALALPLMTAQAAGVVYQGVLAPGVAQTGTAGGFAWFLDQGSGVQFWQFQSPGAGAQVTLAVDRLNANFDPGLSLYQGLTSADTSAFSGGASWGGMNYLGSLDDEHAPFLAPGPNGDPYGSFTLPAAGWYTVAVGGGLSTDAGIYPYRITLTAVPEPGPGALLAAGLVVLALARRRR